MLTRALKSVLRETLGEGEDFTQVKRQNAELRRQLDFETRRSAEYFSLIERLEAQRDERWTMFLQQASEHCNAQFMLEDSLIFARDLFNSMLAQLNALREKQGLEPIRRALDLADPPVGTAAEYKARVTALREQADAIIDARKERASMLEKFSAEEKG